MKFIKKNKSTVVALLIFVAVFVAFLILKNTIMFDENQAIYGNRLEGEESVKLSSQDIDKVKEEVKDMTKSVDVTKNGKIINIIAYTNPDITLEVAKTIGDKALTAFSDEQKKFYDIQLLIDNEDNQDQFPIIGYKHRNKEGISWTKDRVKTEG